jgi:hypothetical protein
MIIYRHLQFPQRYAKLRYDKPILLRDKTDAVLLTVLGFDFLLISFYFGDRYKLNSVSRASF